MPTQPIVPKGWDPVTIITRKTRLSTLAVKVANTQGQPLPAAKVAVTILSPLSPTPFYQAQITPGQVFYAPPDAKISLHVLLGDKTFSNPNWTFTTPAIPRTELLTLTPDINP
jgi:hypothetical protein